MDKKYVTLFKDIALTMASSAEAVMDYDRQNNDEKGLETATAMRNDYNELVDRISNTGDDYQLTRGDAARLLVGGAVIINQIRDKITAYQNAITGYQRDVLPKLQVVIDNSTTDEEAIKIAEEKFIIENNK